MTKIKLIKIINEEKKEEKKRQGHNCKMWGGDRETNIKEEPKKEYQIDRGREKQHHSATQVVAVAVVGVRTRQQKNLTTQGDCRYLHHKR